MKRIIALTSALCCVAGCTADILGTDAPGGVNGPGLITGANGGNTAGAANSGGGTATHDPSDPNAAGPLPLRRLTRLEYNSTVADLLGDTSRPADDFPADERGDSLFPVAGDVDSLFASRFADAAQALAAAADLSKIVPCQPSGDGVACATTFVNTFGAKAFRRPLLPAERDRLLAVYQSARSGEGLDFNGGIRSLIEAMLQSPAFLYHWELGPQPARLEGGWVRLGPYELASRLSYFLWGSMPDDELMAAAAADKLSSEAELKDQATRMLASPRAQTSIKTFFSQWLGLDQMSDRSKDANTYPEFTDELKAAMTSELDALTTGVVLAGDGRIETLLTTPEADVTSPVAKLYGISMSGTASQHVTLDATQRSGLLTRVGFQALFGGPKGSNPIKRGVEIYKRLLCGTVPAPPANVPPAKDPSEGGTTRQRLAEHSQNECAKGCHSLFDGIGYAFENYDGIGRYRTMDNGLPVDASASILLDGKQVAFKNGVELSQHLAESAQVKQCLASQAATFGLGRAVVPEDKASLQASLTAYASGSGGLRDLLAALVASRTFRYRAPADGEMLQ